MERAARIVLWLFVINLGIALGAGLYESRIEVPQWLTSSPDQGLRWNAEAAREADTGLRFWVFVTTGPLTILTLLNLVAAWRARGPARRWWLGAALTALADRVVTFGFFIPRMVELMSGRMAQPDAVELATTWILLNHGRHVLTLLALLLALQTFATVYRQTSPATRIG